MRRRATAFLSIGMLIDPAYVVACRARPRCPRQRLRDIGRPGLLDRQVRCQPEAAASDVTLISRTIDESAFCWCRNTWSTNWGEDGYIRIARQPADCGIATEPIYVDLEVA